jgi:hypothetical protein
MVFQRILNPNLLGLPLIDAGPTHTYREIQLSTNQALAELEGRKGKPGLILEEPEMTLVAKNLRCGAGQASHFEFRMALLDPRQAAIGKGSQAMGER